MGFKTRGQVIGVNGTRDVIVGAQGSIFTEASATNAEQGGTLATAVVKADGSGRVTVKIDGRLIHEFVFTPSGRKIP